MFNNRRSYSTILLLFFFKGRSFAFLHLRSLALNTINDTPPPPFPSPTYGLVSQLVSFPIYFLPTNGFLGFKWCCLSLGLRSGSTSFLSRYMSTFVLCPDGGSVWILTDYLPVNNSALTNTPLDSTQSPSCPGFYPSPNVRLNAWHIRCTLHMNCSQIKLFTYS